MVYAILQYSEFRYPVIQFVLAITFIVISFFAHPVAIYPLSFIIGYSAIDKNQLHSLKPYILLIFTGSLAIGKVLFTSENSYEGKFFSELINSPSIIFDFAGFYSTKFFIDRLNGLYLWLVILELVLVTLLIFKKEYIKLIWQLCFLFFFLAISLITYHQGDSDLLMERAFMPLALFIAVPLLNETIKNNFKFTIPKVVLLTIIIGISLNRIYAQGTEFQARTEFSKELLRKTAKFSNKKFIVHQNKIERHILTFWSYSIETLLLSAITEDLPTQTIYSANNPEELSKYTTNPNSVFLGPNFWLEWDIESLNSNYFVLPENTPYKIIDIDNLN
ncbi:MAG: hypothetical protein JW761_03320 [Prolixibacteraceae bacterium]|nr:hypothetical protein [Prolixibacteraceae bacterium]